MITVFTPAYNRAYIIHKLYDSLCRQSYTNFEWIVVDDGSTDNTRELIAAFIAENKISLRYYRQENSGKHIAINRGVQEAKGELFFIVDSDDYLTDNALDELNFYYEQIKNNNDFAGISGTRITPQGKSVADALSFDILDSTLTEFSIKFKYPGDFAEAYKTEILRKHPFPRIEGEKFCPESLVWNRIAQKYKLRYFNKGIYVCEYRSDGLTAKITRIRMQSPVASMIHYAELSKHPLSLWKKIRAGINFWRFAACSTFPLSQKCKIIGKKYALLYFIGQILHCIDYLKNKKIDIQK